ncbi:uncharacterized protein LTR77_010071 [Saxophila tyrrhenica]|uniref:Uncharacterized protein n=1 Tax=Saxophila tyrrhenica TaxID=1690608 RepID=A0AAV9NZF6_9PEZI|nr:hypothetical protein LTR77_010071 [Saxophila tyrrhenica]
MLSRRLLLPKSIHHLRPLRPPNRSPSNPRLFTQNTSLLLIARHTPRPQLPYLSQPTAKHSATRLISTETRAYVREVSLQSVKWTGIIFVFMLLGGVALEGVKMESDEREHPTPGEWKFLTRQALRMARAGTKVVEEQRAPIVDWPMVGGQVKECLKRLEDLDGDGKGLVVQGAEAGDDGALVIPEVGRAGFDVDAKSYEWKTGYFEALMLAATAAEHLENIVLDTRRKMVFPREVVVGPSNPDARPTPVYMGTAPNEEDCVKFYEPPETFYMRMLTTKGFTTRQRLDAAEGYANWLEFKGLHESAEEMYRWGIDIAKSALPNPLEAAATIDPNTNVLKPDARSAEVTSNLLRATSALAVHHARTNNIPSALPILLSVLRARRNAPLSPYPYQPHQSDPNASTDIGAAFSMVKGWISPAKFPPPPPSGDDPLVRYSSKPTCEEGELMVYIGEILFASAPERASEGVGWTRQGVLVAEANLQNRQQAQRGAGKPAITTEDGENEGRKCKECLLTGVKNWELMLQRLATSRATSTSREGGRSAGWLEWRGWFGGDGGVKGQTMDGLGQGMLEEELKQVGRLRERIVKENIEAELAKGRVSGAPWYG